MKPKMHPRLPGLSREVVPAKERVKNLPHPLIPAGAGIKTLPNRNDSQWGKGWVPAFAGTSGGEIPLPRLRGQAHCIIAFMAVTAATILVPAGSLSAQSAEPPAAWRVECVGDGKSLECRAIQQIVQRDARQQLVPFVTVAARFDPQAKAGSMQILLPLGLNLTEPVSIKVDNGPAEKQPIQTCNNGGCLVTMTANDKLLAAMRAGTDLKLTVQDATKKPIEMALPLLGFGIAYDKTK
jgi:invasion protein IalB